MSGLIAMDLLSDSSKSIDVKMKYLFTNLKFGVVFRCLRCFFCARLDTCIK